MPKAKTIKINHRNLGTVLVKIDAEDIDIFEENSVYVTACGSSKGPLVRLNPDTTTSSGYRPFASRVILEKHGLLDPSKNVFYLNGHYDLRKSQLFQVWFKDLSIYLERSFNE